MNFQMEKHSQHDIVSKADELSDERILQLGFLMHLRSDDDIGLLLIHVGEEILEVIRGQIEVRIEEPDAVTLGREYAGLDGMAFSAVRCIGDHSNTGTLFGGPFDFSFRIVTTSIIDTNDFKRVAESGYDPIRFQKIVVYVFAFVIRRHDH